MTDVDITGLLGDERVNAVLGWVLVGAILLVTVGSFLEGNIIWAGFAATVALLAVMPSLVFLSARTMLPWEVLLLAGLPILGRVVATFRVSSQVATYLSVAALALIVAVELNAFTSVRMTPTFAVVFVAITTMAAAGVWAVVRWSLDIMFGTAFLFDPGLTEAGAEAERGVMIEFVASTIAGLLAGVVFEFYVRRRAIIDPRMPDSAGGAVPPEEAE
ncbi:MAG: hypothetical protein V5A39_13370 [Haloarculaceae archaeon]